jgi:hypothetical protein
MPKIVVADNYWWQSIAVDPRTGALDFAHDDRQPRWRTSTSAAPPMST